MEFNFDGPSGTLQIVIALLIGLGTMGYGVYSYSAQSAAVDSTDTVEATIVSTGIERVDQRRGTDDFSPQVTFNYTFEGEQYTASNMYPGGITREFETKEDIRELLEGYEPGATKTAYVPTDAPQNAFLKHQSSNKPLYVIGLSVIMLLGTIVSIFRG